MLERCNTENPSPEDIETLREELQARPKLWRLYGDLAEVMTREMIEGIQASRAIKESVEAGRKAMRGQLNYDKSPLLEQMLIDHVILCWLRLQMAEHAYTGWAGGSLAQGDFRERRLSAVQRRYLRAVETLARIRRIALPALQINVGDKQVNVAG